MSADTRLEERGGSGLGEVDEPTFTGLAERHRRELHVHCYRMLGSFGLGPPHSRDLSTATSGNSSGEP